MTFTYTASDKTCLNISLANHDKHIVIFKNIITGLHDKVYQIRTIQRLS